jgi:hypothetical protein
MPTPVSNEDQFMISSAVKFMLSDNVNARGSGLREDRAGTAKAVVVLSKLLSQEEEGRVRKITLQGVVSGLWQTHLS